MPVADSKLMLSDNSGGGRLPVPDPTILTTQASEKAVAALKELIIARLEGLENTIDKLQTSIDNRPAAIVQEINHLRVLTDEKFKGVDQQFAGRDTALAAALLAQKTSVEEQNKSNALSAAKSEAATTKQIDGIQAIISSSTKATDDKIDGVKDLLASLAQGTNEKAGDLRERLQTMETRSLTSREVVNDNQAHVGVSWGIAGIVISAALGIVGVVLTIIIMGKP